MSNFVIDNGVLTKYIGSGGVVVVPDGVTSIAGWLFCYCDNLTEVILPDGLTSIGEFAFVRCRNLTKVTIPDSVTDIGASAFAGCERLTDVTLPDGVCIGERAFSNCTHLKMNLPDTVAHIGSGAFYGCEKLADVDGFVIVRNVLYDYCGSAEEVTIPSGVTAVSSSAFGESPHLKCITIPDSVTLIGRNAFYSCRKLVEVKFGHSVTTIDAGAFAWCRCLTDIHIPDSTTTIGAEAFSGCEALTSITLPDGLSTIGHNAFEQCNRLVQFHTIAESIIRGDTFASALPAGLADKIDALYPAMHDSAVKKYLLNSEIWPRLDRALQCRIFMERTGKAMLPAYQKCVSNPEILGEDLLPRLTGNASAKTCAAAATFITLFSEKVSVELLKKIYLSLKPLKNAAKALPPIESDPILMDILGTAQKSAPASSPVVQMLNEILRQRRLSSRELAPRMKTWYGIVPSELPTVQTADQTDAPPEVLMFLLAAHETLRDRVSGPADVVVAYPLPGICPDSAALAAELDADSLQCALRTLADNCLGAPGRTKKMFLAYPICRYADEALMMDLTKRVPSWRSSGAGDNAPPLATFRKANIYSNTRSAMLLADRYQELDHYAVIRNTDADTIRDRYLSDVGLDAQGAKIYDLGNQTVTVRLQNDLSFLVELSTGKTAKSLPKKNADAAKYAAANTDFSEMKKAVKKIVKNRVRTLFGDFLSGHGRTAAAWQEAYLRNVLLRPVASLLVWHQGTNTFIVTENGPVTVTGDAYTIADKPEIKVAHPMEMLPEEVTAWQKYFTAHGLKQPFEQIWEPVIDGTTVTKERYKDCRIPYYRFTGQEKHGITVKSMDFYEGVDFDFRGCSATIERLDFQNFPVAPDDCFEVQSFAFDQYTRQVNHLVAYLDRVTIYDRIRKDDADIVRYLPRFTLAQITEFIRVAGESNSTNAMAVLLEYKNNTFADFDPMEEFSLDW